MLLLLNEVYVSVGDLGQKYTPKCQWFAIIKGLYPIYIKWVS